jgi:hypothetical protein
MKTHFHTNLEPQANDYKYSPTIILETTPEDENEIYKINLRSFRIQFGFMESLSALLPSCSSITTLIFWNCGFNENHLDMLVTTLLPKTCFIRKIQIDQSEIKNTLSFVKLLINSLYILCSIKFSYI